MQKAEAAAKQGDKKLAVNLAAAAARLANQAKAHAEEAVNSPQADERADKNYLAIQRQTQGVLARAQQMVSGVDGLDAPVSAPPVTPAPEPVPAEEVQTVGGAIVTGPYTGKAATYGYQSVNLSTMPQGVGVENFGYLTTFAAQYQKPDGSFDGQWSAHLNSKGAAFYRFTGSDGQYRETSVLPEPSIGIQAAPAAQPGPGGSPAPAGPVGTPATTPTVEPVATALQTGVPVAVGAPHPSSYAGIDAVPVDPASLQAIYDTYARTNPSAVAGLRTPLAENYAYAEMLINPKDPTDISIRAYNPTGGSAETSWLRGALASTGGAYSTPDRLVAQPAPTGALTQPLGTRSDLVKTVDISVHSGYLSMDDIEQLKADGVTHVVVGTQDMAVTKQQLSLLVANGFTVDAYIYVYPGNTEQHVKDDLAALKDFPIGTYWLDLEDPQSADWADVTRRAVNTFNSVQAGDDNAVQLGIYTSKGFWDSYMGGSTEFSNLPLWQAQWPDDPTSVNESNFLEVPPFGGFTAVARQYTDTIYLRNPNHPANKPMAYDADYMLIPSNQRSQTFSP
ncbi:MAG: GH25 family lysozyme [Myxococcaceae bacterium]